MSETRQRYATVTEFEKAKEEFQEQVETILADIEGREPSFDWRNSEKAEEAQLELAAASPYENYLEALYLETLDRLKITNIELALCGEAFLKVKTERDQWRAIAIALATHHQGSSQ